MRVACEGRSAKNPGGFSPLARARAYCAGPRVLQANYTLVIVLVTAANESKKRDIYIVYGCQTQHQ